MTDDEIVKRLVEIQFMERWTQIEMANEIGLSAGTLSSILNKKRKISNNRRRFLEAFFRLYDLDQ